MTRQSNRTVLITGCTSGFGKILVQQFLQNGDRVVATGRNLTQRPEALATERQKYGKQLRELDLDVTVPAQRALVLGQIPSLDILINNAGYGLCGALEDTDAAQVRQQMEVNFFATVFMTQEFLPLLRKSRGQIFNFSSGFGLVGFPLNSLYCASKFAIEGFSEALAHEVNPFGVQVCLVEPGAYRTDFGRKMLWGSRAEQSDSPYRLQTENYKKLMSKLTQRRNPPQPADVASKILALSQSNHLPMRVRSGKDVQMTHWMKRLMPGQAFHQLSRLFYRRLFLKEAR